MCCWIARPFFFSNVVRGQRLVSAQWIKSRDADRFGSKLHAAGYAGWRNCGRAELIISRFSPSIRSVQTWQSPEAIGPLRLF